MSTVDSSNALRVAVVGQGLLGRGIAACLLGHGLTVIAVDSSERQLADAGPIIAEMIEEMIEFGGADRGLRSEWAARYVPATDCAGLHDCSFVVESVTEDLVVKAAALYAIEAEIGPAVVIASNTSAIPISKLQQGRRHPQRLIGMHWAGPAHATRFMELIRGDQTSDETMEVAATLARRVGKDPCVCRRDVPGFIVNRMAYAMYREALHLLETGVADADTIDRAARNVLGLWTPLCGPLRWIDISGGPELYAQAMRPVLPTLSQDTHVPRGLQELVTRGARGSLNGRGFFNYTPEEARQWQELYQKHAWRMTRLQEEYYPLKKTPTA